MRTDPTKRYTTTCNRPPLMQPEQSSRNTDGQGKRAKVMPSLSLTMGRWTGRRKRALSLSLSRYRKCTVPSSFFSLLPTTFDLGHLPPLLRISLQPVSTLLFFHVLNECRLNIRSFPLLIYSAQKTSANYSNKQPTDFTGSIIINGMKG